MERVRRTPARQAPAGAHAQAEAGTRTARALRAKEDTPVTDAETDGAMIEFCGRLSALEIIVEFVFKKSVHGAPAIFVEELLKELRDSVRTLHVPESANRETAERLGLEIALETRKGVERFCRRLGLVER
jgi:hypothetical protein